MLKSIACRLHAPIKWKKIQSIAIPLFYVVLFKYKFYAYIHIILQNDNVKWITMEGRKDDSWVKKKKKKKKGGGGGRI